MTFLHSLHWHKSIQESHNLGDFSSLSTLLFALCFLFSVFCYLLLPIPALAQPPINCAGLPGCTSPPVYINVINKHAIPKAIAILIFAIGGLSLLFVMIGGARYMLSFGREEENTKAFETIKWALLGLVVSLLAHRIVYMVTSTVYVTGPSPLLSLMQTVASTMTFVLNSVFLLVLLLSGMRMVKARGNEEEAGKGRQGVIYAIIGAVIINVAPYVVKQVLVIGP